MGSQQLTDTLRGQFAAPFRMKYLFGVMAVINGLTLISLKYQFFWPAACNILNIVLYAVGLALVFKHFQNPNVPTDLATTAASMIGSTADASRIDSLERNVKALQQELEELKTQLLRNNLRRLFEECIEECDGQRERNVACSCECFCFLS